MHKDRVTVSGSYCSDFSCLSVGGRPNELPSNELKTLAVPPALWNMD